jgi:hypothetical protein
MRQRPSRTLWTTIDAVTNLVLTVAAIGVVYALVIGFAPGADSLGRRGDPRLSAG